ncbi:MAG: glutamine--fructose-6-phosphate aminotransferase [Patescibacteria group bacterium]|nr:glutamine--fructose-6-phosphate aminotransferase [Patescibacteria group bacterium]
MCGIIAYIGKEDETDNCLAILEDLSYRGYDGAGVRAYGRITKVVGHPSKLKVLIEKDPTVRNLHLVIAHTRWATHGRKDNELNVHPHQDGMKRFTVVQNGMISNSEELKKEYLADYVFLSETDTEVVPALLAHFSSQFETTEELIKHVLGLLEATYGFVIHDAMHPDVLFAIRSGSTLSIGRADHGIYVCSDESFLHKYAKTIATLGVNELCTISAKDFQIKHLETGAAVTLDERTSSNDQEIVNKGSYDHWMQKELNETPERMLDTLRGRYDWKHGNVTLNGLREIEEELLGIAKIILIGCGTSRNAGLYGKMILEKYARIPTEVIDASVFIERNPIITEQTLVIALSQSGETADVIGALQEAKIHRPILFGIVNAVDSSIARICGAGVYLQVGREIGVASTKAFFGQCAVLALVAIHFGRKRGTLSQEESIRVIKELQKIPRALGGMNSEHVSLIKNLVKSHDNRIASMLIGSDTMYAGILEMKLKLEEICYEPVCAEVGASLKHGPLAIISSERNNLVFAFLSGNETGDKQIRDTVAIAISNGAHILLFYPHGTKSGSYAKSESVTHIQIPAIHQDFAVFVHVYLMQWFAYYAAVELGHDPDHPRNLAKSVTV